MLAGKGLLNAGFLVYRAATMSEFQLPLRSPARGEIVPNGAG